ncbi:MAG: cobalamin biosynthesis protein CbiX [Candidatus Poribacteria bacterium]|nr:cobalamin biosynthesis protein CbiX [Candidatus Poribacteria bacterium]
MKTGIVIVDHGSKRDAANRMLEVVVEMARARGVYDVIEVAHMELAEPTIAQAFARCVEQGAQRVIVHPYFLSPGRHSQSDIPRMAREAAARFPRVQVAVTEPLGLDERLIDVTLTRITEAIHLLETEPEMAAS